jgi:hypothetical protein
LGISKGTAQRAVRSLAQKPPINPPRKCLILLNRISKV